MRNFIAVASLLLMSLLEATAAVTITKAPYGGWPNCYKITNGEVELIVTSDVGPRVIRYGFVGGQNIFKEFSAQLGKSGERMWQARGGHRIWIAPEDARLTYAPDNGPVKIEVQGDTLIATEPVEPTTGLEKQIVVKLAATGTDVEVTHRIKNTQAKTVQWAPWALTMMSPGGHGITGFPPRGTHPRNLAPTNPLVMFAFTNLADPRWTFTRKYMILHMDPKNTGQPQKLGTFNPDTWGAYSLNNELFIKRTKADPTKHYADMGASYETFTNAEFLELETLGPLTSLSQGQTMEHVEHWTLHKNVSLSQWTDEELDRVILPLLK